MTLAEKYSALSNRFWSKVEKGDQCWNWAASIKGGSRGGYGLFWMNGVAKNAHRVSWLLKFGAIPEGMSVLHKCDNRKCVNPDHLYLGDNSQNMKDCAERGRMFMQTNRERALQIMARARLYRHKGAGEGVLTELERDVLDCLGDEWVRPMDIGGRDASHHSRTLARLVRMGLVERKRRAGWCRPSYLYRAAVEAKESEHG